MIGAPARDVRRVVGQRGARGDLGQLREDDLLFPVVVKCRKRVKRPQKSAKSVRSLSGTGAAETRTIVSRLRRRAVWIGSSAWAIRSCGAEAFIAHTIRDGDEKKRLAL